MQIDKWKVCGEGEMPDLKGKACWIGVDLSKKIDLTSISFEFALDDGSYAVLSHSFIPEDTLAGKRQTDKFQYDLMVRQGWITATPGAVVDYRFIMKYIKDQVESNGWIVQEICFDPYNATQFAEEMTTEGFNCIEIRQGIPTLSEPTKNFREEVYQGNVVHNNNPVLTWAFSNAVVKEDHNENIQLDKAKSTARIDPAAAVINSHVRAMQKPEESVYERRDVRTV
jgi:phage terminase large subunit-like protein